MRRKVGSEDPVLRTQGTPLTDTAVRGPGVVRSAVNVTRDAKFTEYARAVSDQQLLLAPVEPAVKLDLVEGTIADELVDVSVIAAPAPLESQGRNLFSEARSPPGPRRRARGGSTPRSSARSATGSAELGRPPLVADLDTDATAQPAVHRTLHRAPQSPSQPATPCFRQPDPPLSLPTPNLTRGAPRRLRRGSRNEDFEALWPAGAHRASAIRRLRQRAPPSRARRDSPKTALVCQKLTIRRSTAER